MNALADSLQSAFLDSGMSKSELAKSTNLAIQYLTAIFKGTKEPDKWDIKRICKGMGVEPDDFLDIDSGSPVKKQRLEPIKKEVRYPKLEKATAGTKLQKAEGMCIYPGCFKPATENAHINCHDQGLFGSGTGLRADNIFTAEFCHEHHMYFHDFQERKSLSLSDEFKTCILLTIHRKIQQGRIILV